MRPRSSRWLATSCLAGALTAAVLAQLPAKASLIDPVLRQPQAAGLEIASGLDLASAGAASGGAVTLDDAITGLVASMSPGRSRSDGGGRNRPAVDASVRPANVPAREDARADHATVLLVGLGLVAVSLRRFTA